MSREPDPTNPYGAPSPSEMPIDLSDPLLDTMTEALDRHRYDLASAFKTHFERRHPFGTFEPCDARCPMHNLPQGDARTLLDKAYAAEKQARRPEREARRLAKVQRHAEKQAAVATRQARRAEQKQRRANRIQQPGLPGLG
jgi:hypothetical protein